MYYSLLLYVEEAGNALRYKNACVIDFTPLKNEFLPVLLFTSKFVGNIILNTLYTIT